jgi:hypothetical protein
MCSEKIAPRGEHCLGPESSCPEVVCRRQVPRELRMKPLSDYYLIATRISIHRIIKSGTTPTRYLSGIPSKYKEQICDQW